MALSNAISTTGLSDDNVIFTANKSKVERLEKKYKVMYAAMPQLVLVPVYLNRGGFRGLDQAAGSEDSYFPKTPSPDTAYYHQSTTEPWSADWQGTFDLVHSRMVLPGVGLFPVEDIVKNLIALVKPGDCTQLIEIEWNGWDSGARLNIFHDAMKQLVAMMKNKQGVDMRLRLMAMLEAAGMTNLQCNIVNVPLGARAQDEVQDLSLQSMFATASFARETLTKLPPIEVPSEDLDSMPDALVGEPKEAGGEQKLFALWAQKPFIA